MIPQQNLSLLSNRLARKGGRRIPEAVLERDYCLSWLLAGLSVTILRDILAFKHTEEASGVRLKIIRVDRHFHENTYTFFVGYEGPLPGAAGKEVKVDITIRERLVFPVEPRQVLRTYEEYTDFPDGAIIGVYTLHEIAAEKIVAILDPARNEPRDLLADIRETFIKKEARLKKLWGKRLASQMVQLPEFNEVHRRVLREFRQAGLY
jgi:predicted nucleotidyltransferase component of viral defense system